MSSHSLQRMVSICPRAGTAAEDRASPHRRSTLARTILELLMGIWCWSCGEEEAGEKLFKLAFFRKVTKSVTNLGHKPRDDCSKIRMRLYLLTAHVLTQGVEYVRANLFGLTRIPVNHPLDGSAGTFYGRVRRPAVVGSDQAYRGTSLIRNCRPPRTTVGP